MALIHEHSRCAICERPLRLEPDWFATNGVFFPRDHPLWRYCDAPMHWSCYERWPEQPQFARRHFEARLSQTEQNPYWGEAMRAPEVFVEVNPDEPVREARVHLARSGSYIQVPLDGWNGWINDPDATGEGLQSLERKALAAVWPLLQQALPDQDTVTRGVDWTAKERQREQLNTELLQDKEDRLAAVSLHNGSCGHLKDAGVACPYCREPSNIRFVDRSPDDKSYFVCRTCSRSFVPDDVATESES